jgi:nitrate reductase gamma subunit
MTLQPLSMLLFVVLPYAAVVVFVAGLIWRYRSPFRISSLSSQLLESRTLPWGSVPFHAGIAILLLGHLLPLLVPQQWMRLLSQERALLIVEGIGLGGAFLCAGGLVALLVRRLAVASLRRSSTPLDVVVLLMLIAQAVLGIVVAVGYRWGAVWSAATITPYLRGLLLLQPEPAFVAGLATPAVLHLTGAWVILALLPLTRLAHIFSLPLGYLVRRPQKVVWAVAAGRQAPRKPAAPEPSGSEPSRPQPEIAPG